jgi:sarcosine oxidase subunit beta
VGERADCVIIGGGIIGCAVAYQLTRLGCRDLILLEKDFLASKATGVAPGGIRQQFADATACLYARESVRFFERLNEELRPEFPLPFLQTGYLFLAHRPETLETYRKNVEMQNRLDIPSEILGPQEAAERVPGLELQNLLGAAFCRTDGFIEDSHGVTQLMAARAKEAGLRLRFEPALSIELEGQKVRGVRTPTGVIEAGAVVNAAGCDAPELARPLGVEIPIRIEPRRLIYMERIAERLLEPLVAALDKAWAGKQLAEGVIYMGYLKEAAEALDDWNYTEKTVEAAVEVLPALADLKVARIAQGNYDTSPDGQPLLGGISGLDGYYQAVGFSGHGYMLSPAVGKVLAEVVLGLPPSLPLEPFRSDRFRAGSERDNLMI